MIKIVLNVEALRKENKYSIFLGPAYDQEIEGVESSSGSIIYNYYGLIYLEMDYRKDEFDGDFETEKEEFSDQFTDFYDMIADGIYQEFESFYLKIDKYGYPENGLTPPKLFCEDEDACESDCTFFAHELPKL